jgi:hypothetical protein
MSRNIFVLMYHSHRLLDLIYKGKGFCEHAMYAASVIWVRITMKMEVARSSEMPLPTSFTVQCRNSEY